MKQFLCAVFCLVSAGAMSAQTAAQTALHYRGDGGTYYLVERSDISRYDNGKYSGLTRREVRSRISPATQMQIPAAFSQQAAAVRSRNPGGTLFSGSFYIVEETVRNNESTVRGISADVPSVFYIGSDGALSVIQDCGFPVYRSFPSYPDSPVQPGGSWQAEAVRSIDPLNAGTYTRLKMLVQYVFKGEELYKGQPVYRIAAKWATRYGGSYYDRDGDPDLKNASGTHDADILVSAATGAAILIRDRMDETFVYADGSNVRFKGVSLFFTEFPPAVQKDSIITMLRGISGVEVKEDSASAEHAAPSNAPDTGGGVRGDKDLSFPDSFASGGTEGAVSGRNPAGKSGGSVVVEKTDEGVRLSIRNLRFKPDSTELLPSESSRLDDIAAVLLQVPDAMFLVEGHTAAAGKPAGEQALSESRAKKIAAELSNRGIRPDRFICVGRGSTRPVSAGTSEPERAQNRRVEVTILM